MSPLCSKPSNLCLSGPKANTIMYNHLVGPEECSIQFCVFRTVTACTTRLTSHKVISRFLGKVSLTSHGCGTVCGNTWYYLCLPKGPGDSPLNILQHLDYDSYHYKPHLQQGLTLWRLRSCIFGSLHLLKSYTTTSINFCHVDCEGTCRHVHINQRRRNNRRLCF
jgi:hypothetical protein